MTRSLALISYFFLMLPTTYAANTNGNIGLGIMIGDPTAFSFKYGRNTKNAIDAAFWTAGDIDIGVHGDYLWHHFNLFKIDSEPIDAFYGVGARLREHEHPKKKWDNDDTMQLGARIPGGLRWIGKIPLEVFLEVALIFNIVPETDADLDASLGARWFF